MAHLAASAQVGLDESQPVTKAQFAVSSTGAPWNIFRGALLFFKKTSDYLLVGGDGATYPEVDAIFAGVSDEQLVTDTFNSNGAAAGKFVFLVTYGRILVHGCSNLTQANVGKQFAATAFSDNPADLTPYIKATTTGPVGTLDQVTVEGDSGYINLARRKADD